MSLRFLRPSKFQFLIVKSDIESSVRLAIPEMNSDMVQSVKSLREIRKLYADITAQKQGCVIEVTSITTDGRNQAK